MIRNKLSQTDPPPRVDISDTVSPSVIYDYYHEHLKKLEAEKAAAAKKPAKQVNKKEPVKKEVVVEHVKKDLRLVKSISPFSYSINSATSQHEKSNEC